MPVTSSYHGKFSMNLEWDGIERRKSLRVEAETMVARFYPEHLADRTPEKLLHELLVHKVELELQIEELRLTYAAMREMRDSYRELYEFAPVGYLTIDRQGLISGINLTCSALLSLDRTHLIDTRFSNLVAADDQDRWHLLFMKMLAAATGEKHEDELTLKRADASRFNARLECLRWETADSQGMFRVALSEINNIKPAESVEGT